MQTLEAAVKEALRGVPKDLILEVKAHSEIEPFLVNTLNNNQLPVIFYHGLNGCFIFTWWIAVV